MKLASVDVECIIENILAHISQFQTDEGLFKTFRMDYSEKECPNDYINEEKSTFIDTKYDHSFILDIILKLRDYFPNTRKFLDIVTKGLKLVIDDALIGYCDGTRTFQWRYYNTDHQGPGKILPDIDDTGRNLIFIERAREILGHDYVESLSDKFSIVNNPNNYRQFWLQLHPLDPHFKPHYSAAKAKHYGLLTHFGNKEGNDVDPVCNITALYSTLLFFNKNLFYITKDDIIHIKRILNYLFGFLESDICIEKAHEYYEPIVVFYNYSKLIQLCENFQKRLGYSICIKNTHRGRLLNLLLRELKQDKWKNPLEKAFGVTSLIILGYRGNEMESEITDIIENQKNDYWEAFRFYRQRHPHRIFGSKGMTTIACLEALKYWKGLWTKA